MNKGIFTTINWKDLKNKYIMPTCSFWYQEGAASLRQISAVSLPARGLSIHYSTISRWYAKNNDEPIPVLKEATPTFIKTCIKGKPFYGRFFWDEDGFLRDFYFSRAKGNIHLTT